METLSQHHHQFVDQFQLPPRLVRLVSGDIGKDVHELPGDDLGKNLCCAALERTYIRTSRVDGGECSGQCLGHQQVIETVGQCHRRPRCQLIDRVHWLASALPRNSSQLVQMEE